MYRLGPGFLPGSGTDSALASYLVRMLFLELSETIWVPITRLLARRLVFSGRTPALGLGSTDSEAYPWS